MKPMLAAQIEVNEIRFPVYASAKLDGVRGLIIDGQLRTRSLKSIPNAHVSALFSRFELNGLDGELIAGSPTAKDVYRATSSATSRQEGTPDVTFYVFDNFALSDSPLNVRLESLRKFSNIKNVCILEQRLVRNAAELLAYETEMLAAGYEGLILRSPTGTYKQGRSTAKEQGMLKLKRFQDSEAKILEVIEEMENTNTATTNALGRTERSTAQAGMKGKDRAGALLVRDVHTGVQFSIGTGLDCADRKFFWANRETVRGKIVKYKSFLIGVKDAPRFPVYLGGREAWDM